MQVLKEMDSLDLYPKLTNHGISTENHVMNLDITRLTLMGVTIGRGDTFLREAEQRRTSLLKPHLETLNSLDLCSNFADNRIEAKQLFSLDHDSLKKLGVSGIFRRRSFLSSVKKYKKGNSNITKQCFQFIYYIQSLLSP